MAATAHKPRIALLGFGLEANALAPVTTEADFRDNEFAEGDALLALLATGKVDAFLPTLQALTDTDLVAIGSYFAGAGGPCDHAVFESITQNIISQLQTEGPFDGVYVMGHGAGATTQWDDMDGPFLRRIRSVVGPDAKIVVNTDLHGNISNDMVEAADVLVTLQTNPHVDWRERSMDCAHIMHALLTGDRATVAFTRLPIIIPQVSQLTAPGQPYGDLIRYGQSLVDEDVFNISIWSGFALSDTRWNGMAISVATRNAPEKAQAILQKLAERAWSIRGRYVVSLTPLSEVGGLAKVAQAPSASPIVLADVADNPGGGGRGNTMFVLEELLKVDAQGVQGGVIFDPAVVAAAEVAGEGASLTVAFNTQEDSPFSEIIEVRAVVEKLTDGVFTGVYGTVQNARVDLGRSCLLRIGGIHLCVVSIRQQIYGADYLEHFGLDPQRASIFWVKSRGHFRAGFEHLVDDAHIYEIDAPGLMPVNLSAVDWKRIPTPTYPMQPETTWSFDQAEVLVRDGRRGANALVDTLEDGRSTDAL